MRAWMIVVLSLLNNIANCQRTDTLLSALLRADTSTALQRVLAAPDTFRLQIIYTRIDRDRFNRPHFHNYYFHADPDLYFNPASTVKLPLALLSLEKLNRMAIPGVDKYTTIQFDSSNEKQVPLYRDTSAKNGLPSIAQFTRKAFLVSDNDAYNRFYQFVGQQEINHNLHAKGYHDVRITRQFMPLNAEQNRHTNQVRFLEAKGRPIFTQPPQYNTDSFEFPQPILVGTGHMDNNDSLIHTPMDFTRANNISLEDLQQILQSVIFPDATPPAQRFFLTDDDYRFVYRYLSQYPSETEYPKYDTAKFYDGRVKFFFKNDQHTMPAHLRVFNKVGWSYGFLTDVSYIADFSNRIEFMLSATLYVNSDGILNDDRYDYDSIGYPFLRALGKTVYEYELARPRKYRPKFGRLRLSYHLRRNDDRPLIRDVDN